MTKRKIILGEYLEFEKGISVPRDRLSITNNIAYLHYGDIYKIYNHVVDINKEIDNILKISTDEKYKKTQLLKDGDIVYNLTSESVDDLGKAVYIRNPNNIPFVSGMETTIMRVTDKSILLPEYLNYILSTYKFKCLLRQYVTGMKVYRVHPRDIGRIEIEVPDINEQKKIIDILNPFNDKIELNNQMNQTLEEIASLLYKRWFVDFEFPDDKGNPYKSSGGEMVDSELGMIPKGWEVKELGELVSICNGYSYRGTDLMKSESAMITIKNFDRNGGFKKNGFKEINLSQKLKEDHFAYRGDLFIAHTDLTQNADIIGNPIILMTSLNYEKIIYSMDVVKIKSMKNDFGNAFLKQIFYNKRFKKHALSYTSGTTVLHLSKKAIKNYRISIPNVVQKSTIDIFEKILRKQMILIEENIVLENTGQYLSKKIILKNMKR